MDFYIPYCRMHSYFDYVQISPRQPNTLKNCCLFKVLIIVL